MKDILIITNYYPPETGAASNRINHLAEGLKKNSFNVTVITPLPNYPKGEIFKNYKGKFKDSSNENGINIHRLWIYASNSENKFLRLFAMLSYSFSLICFFTWNKIPKKVIIQSPPLIVAFTCILLLKSRNRKLILNVSDLWPLAGLELGVFRGNWSYKLLEKIEKFNYVNANLVLGQSEEILSHVKSISSKTDTFLYRNFPDFESPTNKMVKTNDDKIRMVYAGLLGVAQGIYKLCQELDYSNIEFHIYGAGSEQQKIEEFITKNPGIDIYYHGEVSRRDLHNQLMQYHITIIPLLNRIYGAVPSKIFEYAQLGIPIIFFGGGEGETIIKENKLGWIADAGNYSHLNSIINTLNLNEIELVKDHMKKSAEENFNFQRQLEQLIIKIQ